MDLTYKIIGSIKAGRKIVYENVTGTIITLSSDDDFHKECRTDVLKFAPKQRMEFYNMEYNKNPYTFSWTGKIGDDIFWEFSLGHSITDGFYITADNAFLDSDLTQTLNQLSNYFNSVFTSKINNKHNNNEI